MLKRRLIRLARQQRVTLAPLLLSLACAVLVSTVPVLDGWSRLSGWLALWGLVCAVLLALGGRPPPSPHPLPPPGQRLAALKSMYVSGEIDQAEFERRLSTLIQLSVTQEETTHHVSP